MRCETVSRSLRPKQFKSISSMSRICGDEVKVSDSYNLIVIDEQIIGSDLLNYNNASLIRIFFLESPCRWQRRWQKLTL